MTQDEYGAMVVLSLEAYSRLVDPIERALDEADYLAAKDPKRLSHEQVFQGLRERLNAE